MRLEQYRSIEEGGGVMGNNSSKNNNTNPLANDSMNPEDPSSIMYDPNYDKERDLTKVVAIGSNGKIVVTPKYDAKKSKHFGK